MSLFSKYYRFNHCRRVLQQAAALFRKKGDQLPASEKAEFRSKILALQTAIENQDRARANDLTLELESLNKKHFKKSWLSWALELVGSIALALLIAMIIRLMWFEPFEIPTGSMRPTFKEQDTLTVSKTQFGINVPFATEHFYFNPDLVQRASIVIFSGDGLPLRDVDTTFFGIFPFKKRYVKRLLGKPGDSIHFYGGKLYIRDKEGNLIEELISGPWMKNLEHIPMLSFEGQPKGQPTTQNRQSVVFNYFNTPLARLSVDNKGDLFGEVYNGKEWVADDLSAAQKPHNEIKTLSDLLGMKNYAMAQIYTADELTQQGFKIPGKGVLYLVLRHTPHLDFSKGVSHTNRPPKMLTTIIPLQEVDLNAVMKNLYTSRFVVSNGRVKRYSHEAIPFNPQSPRLSGVPDGTYEFYNGIAYNIGLGGLASKLPSDHPLYKMTPQKVQLLYNLGIQWDPAFQPSPNAFALPNRYAYFRDGDLYLLGAPLLTKDNPRLKQFIESELKKQDSSSASDPYVAFIDHGIPDPEDKAFALIVPDKQYLALGDNHAMSADSRVFGFVPERNLQGIPELILWPVGNRMGPPTQKPYPTFVMPRLIVWLLAGIIGLASYLIYRYRLRRPVNL